jgi:hypothetical protein
LNRSGAQWQVEIDSFARANRLALRVGYTANGLRTCAVVIHDAYFYRYIRTQGGKRKCDTDGVDACLSLCLHGSAAKENGKEKKL